MTTKVTIHASEGSHKLQVTVLDRISDADAVKPMVIMLTPDEGPNASSESTHALYVYAGRKIIIEEV